MDLALWQHRARIVAWVDLVLTTLALIVTVLMLVVGVTYTTAVVTHKEEIEKELAKEDIPEGSVNVVLWAIWIGTAIMAITVAIDMWAAIMLLKATKPGVELKLALDRARIWRNVAVVFVIVNIIFNVATQAFLSLALGVLFRGILLYVVCKFISALEEAIGATYASPEGVMIKH